MNSLNVYIGKSGLLGIKLRTKRFHTIHSLGYCIKVMKLGLSILYAFETQLHLLNTESVTFSESLHY